MWTECTNAETPERLQCNAVRASRRLKQMRHRNAGYQSTRVHVVEMASS